MHAKIDDMIHPISKAGKYSRPGKLLIRNKFLFKRNEPDRTIKDVLLPRLRFIEVVLDSRSFVRLKPFKSGLRGLYAGDKLLAPGVPIVRNGRIK